MCTCIYSQAESQPPTSFLKCLLRQFLRKHLLLTWHCQVGPAGRPLCQAISLSLPPQHWGSKQVPPFLDFKMWVQRIGLRSPAGNASILLTDAPPNPALSPSSQWFLAVRSAPAWLTREPRNTLEFSAASFNVRLNCHTRNKPPSYSFCLPRASPEERKYSGSLCPVQSSPQRLSCFWSGRTPWQNTELFPLPSYFLKDKHWPKILLVSKSGRNPSSREHLFRSCCGCL